jgi:hypothetical protein
MKLLRVEYKGRRAFQKKCKGRRKEGNGVWVRKREALRRREGLDRSVVKDRRAKNQRNTFTVLQ